MKFAPVIALLFLTITSLAAPARSKFMIVLDPGHGGNDAGASFKEKKDQTAQVYNEKTMTLLIARDLARELIIRGYQVLLTRNEDLDVSLTNRTALANKVKANIFISIHLNSTPDSGHAQGIETYILNHATDASSRRLADLENSVLKDSQANEGAKSSNISLIMKDMILDANLVPSKALACAVQNRIKTGSSKSRGVRQALFYVLLGTDMPSILIEAGFMNSKTDRDLVLNPAARLKIVNNIASAIDDFRLKKPSTQCQVL